MGNSFSQPDRTADHVRPDARARMAKATVRNTDAGLTKSDGAWRIAVGRMIEAVRRSRGLTLDEFAGKLGKDPRQVSRWERGEDRAQFDVILAVPEFHQPLLLAFADLLDHCADVETTIRIRRRA
jgi:DNA-binding transcriptional regulator YiaG